MECIAPVRKNNLKGICVQRSLILVPHVEHLVHNRMEFQRISQGFKTKINPQEKSTRCTWVVSKSLHFHNRLRPGKLKTGTTKKAYLQFYFILFLFYYINSNDVLIYVHILNVNESDILKIQWGWSEAFSEPSRLWLWFTCPATPNT